jgi:hypothetical protein
MLEAMRGGGFAVSDSYRIGDQEIFDIDLDQSAVFKDGRRVTEGDLEAEAKKLERLYPGLRPGGKSLSGGREHSPVIQVVLSKETKERVADAARADGMSVSKWVRRVLEEKTAA